MSQFPQWYASGTHAAPALPFGWDLVKLGGVAFNAKAQLTAGSLPLKIDAKQKKGATAAQPTVHGLGEAHFNLRLVVWTVKMMEDVDDALPLVYSITNPQPVALEHPQAYSLIRLLGTLPVLVQTPSIWTPSSVVHRGWEMSLGLLHWPAASKNATSEAGITSHTPKRPTNRLQPRAPDPVGAGTVLKNPTPSSEPTFGFAPPL